MIDWIQQKWKVFSCEHHYEILHEFERINRHSEHLSWTTIYQLYCPYCDKVSKTPKKVYDEKLREESDRYYLEKKKDEIKKRVLGEIK